MTAHKAVLLVKAYSKDFSHKLKQEGNVSKVIKIKGGCVCFSSKLSKG